MNSYKDLQIYRTAFGLAKDVHLLTMQLPKHELFELGSQLRRSAQSVRANIVEGYGRRRYKNEFLKFLHYSESSLLETESHINMIYELYQLEASQELLNNYKQLGQQLHKFIQYVENQWRSD